MSEVLSEPINQERLGQLLAWVEAYGIKIVEEVDGGRDFTEQVS